MPLYTVYMAQKGNNFIYTNIYTYIYLFINYSLFVPQKHTDFESLSATHLWMSTNQTTRPLRLLPDQWKGFFQYHLLFPDEKHFCNKNTPSATVKTVAKWMKCECEKYNVFCQRLIKSRLKSLCEYRHFCAEGRYNTCDWLCFFEYGSNSPSVNYWCQFPTAVHNNCPSKSRHRHKLFTTHRPGIVQKTWHTFNNVTRYRSDLEEA